jgi:YVTN family beta-propeller protein
VLGAPLDVIGADTNETSTSTRGRLSVEAKIPLGDIKGRIDHLAFDSQRQRLYVAELGNNSVGIVDVADRRVIRTVGGFDEPQGIGYEPMSDAIYVANGGDGSVRVFRGEDFSALGQIQLADDADNVRIDKEAHRIYVGHGAGALAVIDPATRTQLAGISLKGHPESFQLDPAGDFIFINVPEAGEIAVVSRKSQRQVSSWPTGKLRANYPLALDPAKGRVIAIFRHPARLESFELRTGQKLHGSGVCGDSDDVFVDSKRQRVYVICGEGFVDILDSSGEAYSSIGRFRSSEGSRTGLFVSELDRLLLAIRASGPESAAIWVLRPGS